MRLKTRSLAYIAKFLDITLEQAKEVKTICLANHATFPKLLVKYPKTLAWVNSCYHTPKILEIKLEIYNEILAQYGTESFDSKLGFVEYVNSGDTYSPTILVAQNKTYITTLGDFVEKKGL